MLAAQTMGTASFWGTDPEGVLVCPPRLLVTEMVNRVCSVLGGLSSLVPEEQPQGQWLPLTSHGPAELFYFL